MASLSRPTKGKLGEDTAAQALVSAGYEIVARNWRCPLGEIDIIARHEGDLVFIEVRARSDSTDTALESLSPRKRARLLALADAYLEASDLSQVSPRIDVAVVNLRTGEVEVIPHALGW